MTGTEKNKKYVRKTVRVRKKFQTRYGKRYGYRKKMKLMYRVRIRTRTRTPGSGLPVFRIPKINYIFGKYREKLIKDCPFLEI